VYPEFSMLQDQISAFEQQKAASIASRALATKLDWKIGQRITLTGAMLDQHLVPVVVKS